MRAVLFLALLDVSAGPSRGGNQVLGLELQASPDRPQIKPGDILRISWTLTNHRGARIVVTPYLWDEVFPGTIKRRYGPEGMILVWPAEQNEDRKVLPPRPDDSTAIYSRKLMKRGEKHQWHTDLKFPESLAPGTYDLRLVYYSHSRRLILGASEELTSNVMRIQILK